jgi:glycosyltransferase involved in cell wall biosynthesis
VVSLPSKTFKRILLIDLGAPFGGVETYLEALAAALKGRCALLSICALPRLASSLRRQEVKVFCIPPLYTRWSKVLRFCIAIPLLPYLLVRYRIDTVLTNGFLETTLLLLVRLFGREAIRVAHGPSEIERYRWYARPEMFFPRLASLWCLRVANQIVCVSEAVADDVSRIVPKHRIRVIRNWVLAIPPFAERKTVPGKRIRLLYVGRLVQYKGLDLVLKVMKNIEDVELVVAGEGPFRRQLESMATGLSVQFVGFHSDVSQYYESADIFINPSRGPEGLPLVCLEAMSYGLACLFSNLAVHEEISCDGTAAALFNVGDANDLQEKLQRLVQNPDVRTQYGQLAHGTIEARHSAQVATRCYTEAFGLEELS